jgi:type I restriction enzyme, S subunit
MNGLFKRVPLSSVMTVDRKVIDPADIQPDLDYVGLDGISPDGSIRRGSTAASAAIKSTKHQFTKDHILFGKLRPYLRKVAAPDFSGVCSTDILPLLPNLSVEKRYLLHWLRTDELIKLATNACIGANLPRLSPNALLRFEIPLPSFEEQRRIAMVLDMADVLRLHRRDSLQLAEKLVQSVFIELFVRNPNSRMWSPQNINWMAEGTKGAIRTGPFGSQLLHSEFVDHGIAVLGIDNAVKNRFEWGKPRFITPAKYQELKRYKVFPGDLIITIMGTLGRCAIVPDDIPEAINTKHLCCITLDNRKCIPEFLHACLLYHPEVLRQLGVRAKGAVMPGLNMGIIKGLELPLPPIELQEQFKRFAAASTAARVDFEESQYGMNDFFGALQQHAFRGELDLSRVILDPEVDTPAIRELQKPAGATAEPGAALFLKVPQTIEAELEKLDESVRDGEPIPWSADYFKYRILGVQPTPFSFSDVMRKAESVFNEAPPYEEIKGMILEFLGQNGGPARLAQRFDLHIDAKTKEESGRKEIVFEPAP